MSYSENDFRLLDQAFEKLESRREERMRARAGNPSNNNRTLIQALAYYGYTVTADATARTYSIHRGTRLAKVMPERDGWNWLDRLERKLAALGGDR